MSKRVLAIENDYRWIGYFIETVMSLEGYQVQVCADSDVGLVVLRLKPPDLLLLDLAMPRLSGWEIIGAMRSDPSLGNIPIVVLTAAADPEVKDRARTMGVKQLLVKPISAQKLVQVVRKEIGGP